MRWLSSARFSWHQGPGSRSRVVRQRTIGSAVCSGTRRRPTQVLRCFRAPRGPVHNQAGQPCEGGRARCFLTPRFKHILWIPVAPPRRPCSLLQAADAPRALGDLEHGCERGCGAWSSIVGRADGSPHQNLLGGPAVRWVLFRWTVPGATALSVRSAGNRTVAGRIPGLSRSDGALLATCHR